jgi:lysophospholipase L1-like esterase
MTEVSRLVILINIGVNDNDPGDGTEWKAKLLSVIDEALAKWPAAEVYVAKPWCRTCGWSDSMAGWIDEVVAQRSNVFVGFDERVWLKNGADNGYTLTTDGVHPNTAGYAEQVNQWRDVIYPP